MKTNEDLQKDVQNAIKWEPSLNAAEIGVIANAPDVWNADNELLIEHK